MTLAELYKTPEYLHIADQIENHERTVKFLIDELKEKFQNEECAKERVWVIMGNYRPHLCTPPSEPE